MCTGVAGEGGVDTSTGWLPTKDLIGEHHEHIPQSCYAFHALASCPQAPERIPSASLEGVERQQLHLEGCQWPEGVAIS